MEYVYILFNANEEQTETEREKALQRLTVVYMLFCWVSVVVYSNDVYTEST